MIECGCCGGGTIGQNVRVLFAVRMLCKLLNYARQIDCVTEILIRAFETRLCMKLCVLYMNGYFYFKFIYLVLFHKMGVQSITVSEFQTINTM